MVRNIEKSDVLRFETLGDLLEAALDDLRDAEHDGVKIDMSSWLVVREEDHDKACSVCMAGAVMRNRLTVTDAMAKLGISMNRGDDGNWLELYPSDFRDDRTTNALHSLNRLRVGAVGKAIRNFYSESKWEGERTPLVPYEDRYVVSYNDDRETFYSQMRGILAYLRSFGL